ncbi:MAG TPA: hypothetical protein VGN97_19610 [Mesorhizobium sp.]|jgi:hypothetical protein|nr:hypothetical protein [Mesorhizobium sp.]
MLRSIPLMIVPLILFNLAPMGLFGAGSADPWDEPVAGFGMVSGGAFTLDWGTVLVTLGLLLLFAELLKSTRTTNASVVDHLLSIFVFVAFLIEFLLVPAAAHPVFFLLMVIALIDVLAGFSVSLRAAGRDVNWN